MNSDLSDRVDDLGDDEEIVLGGGRLAESILRADAQRMHDVYGTFDMAGTGRARDVSGSARQDVSFDALEAGDEGAVGR